MGLSWPVSALNQTRPRIRVNLLIDGSPSENSREKIAAKRHKKRKKSGTLGFLSAPRGPRMHQAWVPLSGRIKCSDAGPIRVDLLAPVNCRDSFSDEVSNGRRYLAGIVIGQYIHQTLVITLLAAVDGPDQGAIAGIKFFYSRFFFNHFRTVQSKTAFRSHHTLTGYAGGQRPSSQATDWAGNNRDHRYLRAQDEHRRN